MGRRGVAVEGRPDLYVREGEGSKVLSQWRGGDRQPDGIVPEAAGPSSRALSWLGVALAKPADNSSFSSATEKSKSAFCQRTRNDPGPTTGDSWMWGNGASM